MSYQSIASIFMTKEGRRILLLPLIDDFEVNHRGDFIPIHKREAFYGNDSGTFQETYVAVAAVLTAATLMSFLRTTRSYRIHDGTKHIWERAVIRLYRITSMVGFICSLLLLLLSITASLHHVNASDDEPNYNLGTVESIDANDTSIDEEVPFETLAMRVCFIASIISCIKGTMMHIILDRHVVTTGEGKKGQLAIALASDLSILLYMTSYMNDSKYMDPWHNWHHMAWSLLKDTVWDDIIYEKPLKVASFLFIGISLGFCCKKGIWGEKANAINM